jgi:adenylate kinase family enzyme
MNLYDTHGNKFAAPPTPRPAMHSREYMVYWKREEVRHIDEKQVKFYYAYRASYSNREDTSSKNGTRMYFIYEDKWYSIKYVQQQAGNSSLAASCAETLFFFTYDPTKPKPVPKPKKSDIRQLTYIETTVRRTSMKTMLQQFKSAINVGTPLIAIQCYDPEATVLLLTNGLPASTVIVEWDIVRGYRPRNEAHRSTLTKAGIEIDATVNPRDALMQAANLPHDSILLMHNAQHLLTNHQLTQAMWNLREDFKQRNSALVLLGPEFKFPPELQQDMFLLEEPLPTDGELAQIVQRTYADSRVEVELDETKLAHAVDALRGLAAFPAEQSVAMSISKKNGLDINNLWERKRRLISQTPGLSVWHEGGRFDDLGGLDAIKEKMRRIIAGRKPPRVIVWIDEGEKTGLSDNNDLTGTSKDQMSVLLSEMQDKQYTGMILVGVSGSGKSEFAKKVGGEAGVLTIRLDLGEAKGNGLVGQAEKSIRQAMRIVEAVGGVEGAFFMMTSNNISAIKPELKARFTKGVWFFDLPTTEEQEVIWDIYLKKYPEVDRKELADVKAEGFTGREIRACVATAWEERITLAEAAADIIPVAISGRDEIERLRNEAHGNYSSASYAGPYTRAVSSAAAGQGKRKLRIEE